MVLSLEVNLVNQDAHFAERCKLTQAYNYIRVFFGGINLPCQHLGLPFAYMFRRKRLCHLSKKSSMFSRGWPSFTCLVLQALRFV